MDNSIIDIGECQAVFIVRTMAIIIINIVFELFGFETVSCVQCEIITIYTRPTTYYFRSKSEVTNIINRSTVHYICIVVLATIIVIT